MTDTTPTGMLDGQKQSDHNDHMRDSHISSVGIRELKTRISTYLKLVRKGTRVIVTDRGRPVAELCPYHSEADDTEAILKEMLLLREATRSSSEALAPFEPLAIRGESLSSTIIEERDDRV